MRAIHQRRERRDGGVQGGEERAPRPRAGRRAGDPACTQGCEPSLRPRRDGGSGRCAGSPRPVAEVEVGEETTPRRPPGAAEEGSGGARPRRRRGGPLLSPIRLVGVLDKVLRARSAGMTHYTRPDSAATIASENVLTGAPGKGLYAMTGRAPISTARRIVGGVEPVKSVPVTIPRSAQGAFRAPPITGIWNLARRLAGVRVAPGSVDLATGVFTPYSTGRLAWFLSTSERTIAAWDLAATGGIGYEAWRAWSDQRE